MIDLQHIDCMDAMKLMPDKAFDLAIVDPEYGMKIKGPCGRFERYGKLQSVNGKPPTAEYFNELFRVSKKSVVWGGNYFGLPPCQAFLIWDKQQPEGLTFADCEFAWSNLDGVSRIFRMRPQSADIDGRIHPTQKPVKLYEWILTNYAKPGERILDTHGGSLSIAIACHNLGYDLTVCETDREYFEAGKNRLEQHQKQGQLFVCV